jgi:hypothetical protein
MAFVDFFVSRGLIALLGTIALWNLTKVPYFMSFNNDEDTAYNNHGIELSINLGHWVKGYRSMKMRAPACNFFLIHSVLGITLLAMIILTIINAERRRKYCVPFFIFAIVEGMHAIPASAINDAGLAPLFLFACFSLIGTGIYGIYTKFVIYKKDVLFAEMLLLFQYTIIGTINCFAAVLEIPNIMSAFAYNKEHDGEWKSYGEDPHHIVGHTIYDKLPERVGFHIFLIFTISVWFLWPLFLADIKPVLVKRTKTVDGESEIESYEATETTPLNAII